MSTLAMGALQAQAAGVGAAKAQDFPQQLGPMVCFDFLVDENGN